MRQAVVAAVSALTAGCAHVVADGTEDLGATMFNPNTGLESPAGCAEVDAFAPLSHDDVLRKFAAVDACRLPVDDISIAVASHVLGEEEFALDADEDVLTVLARQAESDSPPRVCCSLQTDMEQVGDSGLWAARYRLRGLKAGMLFFIKPSVARGILAEDDKVLWRGSEAPPEPAEAEPPDVRVVDVELWSESLGETRRVHVYLPPGHDAAHSYPAVFIADGAGAGYYGALLQPLINAGKLPPLIVVGAGSGQGGIVEDRSTLGIDLRAADYLPNFPAADGRFDRHMTFFAEELVDYAVAEYGVSTDPRQRAVQGSSNGGTLALWAGLLHPDKFRFAAPMSPAWKELEWGRDAGAGAATFYLSAGYYEPRFHYRAMQHAEVLRARGYTVHERYISAGHAPDQWEILFLDFVADVFAPAAARREAAPRP